MRMVFFPRRERESSKALCLSLPFSPPPFLTAPPSLLSRGKKKKKRPQISNAAPPPPHTNENSDASPPDFDALAADLPDDHPFAVRAEVSPEEAELAAARLRVRRGLPLRDLSGARGFSDEEKR